MKRKVGWGETKSGWHLSFWERYDGRKRIRSFKKKRRKEKNQWMKERREVKIMEGYAYETTDDQWWRKRIRNIFGTKWIHEKEFIKTVFKWITFDNTKGLMAKLPSFKYINLAHVLYFFQVWEYIVAVCVESSTTSLHQKYENILLYRMAFTKEAPIRRFQSALVSIWGRIHIHVHKS